MNQYVEIRKWNGNRNYGTDSQGVGPHFKPPPSTNFSGCLKLGKGWMT